MPLLTNPTKLNTREIVRLAQRFLAENGSNPGPIDGLWGNRTQEAFEHYKGRQAQAGLSTMTRLAQMFLWRQGFDPGPFDGIWGELTIQAFEAWRRRCRPAPGDVWPVDTEDALTRVFGPPGDVPLVRCTPAYPLRLSWDLATRIDSFFCHEKVRDSLEHVFRQIYTLYDGDLQVIRHKRLDRFGGCYNNRPRKGNLRRPSLHARGAAIDLDPEHNQFRWTRDQASMPEEIIDIFESAGWLSGGRTWGYDFMHFQATS
jgi:hypothetical protein